MTTRLSSFAHSLFVDAPMQHAPVRVAVVTGLSAIGAVATLLAI